MATPLRSNELQRSYIIVKDNQLSVVKDQSTKSQRVNQRGQTDIFSVSKRCSLTYPALPSYTHVQLLTCFVKIETRAENVGCIGVGPGI